MRFRYLTDTSSKEEFVPTSSPILSPFPAKKNITTLAILSACLRERKVAFPVNPKLPTLPKMPKKITGLATCLLTSGSTGTPKIACHSLINYTCSALGSLQRLNLCPSDRWLLSLPLFHVGGITILFRCALAQATVVLSELPLIEALVQHQITHLSLVPTQLYRLLQGNPAQLEKAAKMLKVVLLGGAPYPPTLIEKALSFGFPIHLTYGLTEMTSQVTMDPYPGPLFYREVKLAEDGEIFVRGKTLFCGYYHEYEDLRLDLNDEGWWSTRDLGKWREDGTLEVIGRKDNLFISGGENIQPEEIEAALLCLPEVIEAVVVPIPDPEFGMRPVAYLRQEKELYSLEEVRERLKSYLPSYKIPVSIHPLPLEQSGLKSSRAFLSKEKKP